MLIMLNRNRCINAILIYSIEIESHISSQRYVSFFQLMVTPSFAFRGKIKALDRAIVLFLFSFVCKAQWSYINDFIVFSKWMRDWNSAHPSFSG